MFKTISKENIKEGQRVLIRADWNVPLGGDGQVLDTSRIEATLETIKLAINEGAKAIVMSHLGDGENSLKVVAEAAQKFFGELEIKFIKDPFDSEGQNILASLENGGLAVLENLRFWGEEKDNDKNFAEKLASLGDVYINEAFPSSHRAHASIIGVPKFLPSFAGLHFAEEYQKLSEAFNPAHPFLFILGGAKFETKLPLVEKFLSTADTIFIGGKIAFHALSSPITQNPKVILPVGDITALDIGPETIELLARKIKEAKFVIWNGPLGKYEDGYLKGSQELAKLLGESEAKVIIGGGDTETVLEGIEMKNPNIFVSLAGGAMLDFLSTTTLPGIEALDK